MRLGLTRSGKGAATPAPGLRLSWLPSGNRAVPEARREEGGPQHPRVAEQVLGLGAPYTPGSGRGNSPRMQMSGPEGMAVGTLPGSQGSPAAGTRTSPPWWPRDVLIETFYLFFFFLMFIFQFCYCKIPAMTSSLLWSPACRSALVGAKEVLLSHSIRHLLAWGRGLMLDRQSLTNKKQKKKSYLPPPPW